MKLNNKVIIKVVIIIMATLIILSCGTNNVVTNNDVITEYNEDVVKVATWNLKEFPLTDNTINELQNLIPQLNADVFAIQEVTSTSEFNLLDSYLNDYSVLYTETYIYDPSDEDSYYNPVLGYIYNNQRVTVNASYEIFKGDSRLFPREPFVLDVTWKGINFILINNHLKAGGDNYLNESDEWDEETRRRDALDALHNYIVEHFSDKNVLLMGDFNDQFHEPIETNVFTAFINDDNFVFADYEMSLDSADFSYPGWPSHLDHIIINDNLVDVFAKPLSDCYTIKYDKIMSNYITSISDHRPVIIELDYKN